MTWFRANVRLGARLALVALAIQLALAFGHSHGADRHESAMRFAALPVVSDPAGDPAGNGPTPAQHDPAEAACDICAVMTMAWAGPLPPPPALLPPPPPGDSLACAADAGAVGVPPIRGAFLPRAPPLA